MKRLDRQTITTEAERLERIAMDVEDLGLGDKPLGGGPPRSDCKFQADKLRATAAKLRALTVA